MATEIQSSPALPTEKGAAVRWRQFCEQWRHCYLLLTAVFLAVWIISGPLMPGLENTRIGGLHPVNVLFLMDTLKLSRVVTVVIVVLYAASFLTPTLNTAESVAATALISVCTLALVVLSALLYLYGGLLPA